MTNFVHLHSHSYFSLMDGLDSPAELLAAAKDLGQSAMAVTDHGTLSAHREFQAAAKAAGIKPILGVEAYISPTDRFDKRSSVKAREDNVSLYNHVILLAKDQAGLENIQRLSEIAWTEGFHYKPRIDKEALEKHSSGLIVLSGCMSGLIAKAVEREKPEEALEWTRWFRDAFGEDFYMEVQAHNPPELNAALFGLADDFNIQPVITADCHFARPEDRWVEEAMLILSTNPTMDKSADFKRSKSMEIFERLNYLYPERPISFEQIDVFVSDRLHMEKAMLDAGFDRPEIYENTMAIADKIGSYDYNEGLSLLPTPKTDPVKRLKMLCTQGMKVRQLAGIEEYEQRLKMEIDTISAKENFASYFLIVSDMVNGAKKKGILVGPGRGSAAGSLVCYVLGITEIDPIKYNLLFARFINEERNDFPDIDVDFPDKDRKTVKDDLTKKFKHVASISTFTEFGDKAVIRDASRLFGVPLTEVNRVLKTVDTFDEFVTMPSTHDFRVAHPEVLDLARRLHGRIRNAGMHAAGVVVAREPISKFAPIETRSVPRSTVKERIPVVALDMDQTASIGLIKIDMLGLKTLSVISDTVKLIQKRTGKKIDLVNMDKDDPAVYQDLNNGFTVGVFQAEATPYTNLLTKMGVNDFNDLAASNALVRPGAMNTVGGAYIARKQGREQIRYDHPILEEITKDTYGVIIYQEQVMLACVKLAGFSWSEADNIRKIIGKKKDVHEFDAYKQRFIDGASKHISAEKAAKLWHDFEAHAGYSFNLSHAVAYSTISYWTAWLKHYYPIEFMCALLNNEGDRDSLTTYLIEAKRLGIRVLLPHVNKSDYGFIIENEAIRFGLTNIKYLSEKTVNAVMKHRPYKSHAELDALALESGNGINSRTVQALDAVGAAAFTDHPLTGAEKYNYYEYLSIPMFDVSKVSDAIKQIVTPCSEFDPEGVAVMMAMVKKIKRGKGWALVELVDSSGTTGVFHNENTLIEPGNMYVMLVGNNRIVRYVSIDELDNDNDIFIRWLNRPEIKIDIGKYIVLEFAPRKTKAGKNMATVVLSNRDKELKSALVFDKMFAKSLAKLRPGAVVTVQLDRTQDKTLFVKDIL